MTAALLWSIKPLSRWDRSQRPNSSASSGRSHQTKHDRRSQLPRKVSGVKLCVVVAMTEPLVVVGEQDAGGGAVRLGDDPELLAQLGRVGAEDALLILDIAFVGHGSLVGLAVVLVERAGVQRGVTTR